jgi:acylphosphatase
MDGTVEVEVRGTPEAVDALVAWLGQGPRGARVTGVDVHEIADDPSGPIDEFAVR